MRLFGADFDEASMDERHDDRHNAVEALMWDVAARALTLGVNVILDFGVWAREERDDFRARATRLGAGFQLHFLDVSEAVLLARLRERNANLPPGTFAIPEAKLKEWMTFFQRPTPDEFMNV